MRTNAYELDNSPRQIDVLPQHTELYSLIFDELECHSGFVRS